MILKASKDPVLVKKISLRVWKLKDEIDFKIQKIIEQTPKDQKPDLTTIEKEYHSAMELAEIIPINKDQEVDQSKPDSQDESVEQIRQMIPELPPEKIAIGKAMLSEIYMDKIFLFTGHKYLIGQSIVIEFLIPKRFVINAEVKFCRQLNHKSRIISETRPVYRVVADFTFIKQGERTILRQFIESIKEESLKEDVKTKNDESENDLDELDGL